MGLRKFSTGASRDSEEGKLDFEGALSPIVLKRFAEYMLCHTKQGKEIRSSDNWQKGMSKESYMKSGWRHFHDWWMEHRGYKSREGLEDAICGVIFNSMGYLFEILKEKENEKK